MKKKSLRIAYNVFGVLAALTLPTVVATLIHVPPYKLYFIDLAYPLSLLLLLLLALPPFITLFRKNIHFNLLPLYAAVVGFAISCYMAHFLLPHVNEEGWDSYIRGWEDHEETLIGWGNLAYSTPFALLASIAAILLTVFYLWKKKKTMNGEGFLMEKKPLRIAYNVFGVLAALTLPTVFAVLSYVPPYRIYFDSLLYPLALILLCLLAIPAIIPLFRRDSHCNLLPLYAAVVGYAVSAKMVEFLLPKISPEAWAGLGKGAAIEFSFTETFYTLPFAFLALLAAILLTVFYLRKRKKAKNALTANPTPAFPETP